MTTTLEKARIEIAISAVTSRAAKSPNNTTAASRASAVELAIPDGPSARR